MVRRIVCQRLGLAAQDEVPQLHRPQALDWALVIHRLRREVPVLFLLGPPQAEPRLKRSVLLDPALDSELARLSQEKVQEMFTSYVKLRGTQTLEPVRTMHQVIMAD